MANVNSTKRGHRFKDIPLGTVFGRWTVISAIPASNARSDAYWLCRCECGIYGELRGTDLRNGRTQSCGCLKREHAKQRSTTHGLSKTREYKIWAALIQRCHNPNDKGHVSYGERGITVCSRWRDSFEAFFEDMGRRPSSKHSIERRVNDAGYCKENCYWATRKQQARNRRSNRLLTFNGTTMSVTEWSESMKIPLTTLWNRIYRKWPVERVLTTPVDHRRHPKESRRQA